MRLDKYLSGNGFARSRAKELVLRGRVRVDGAVARDPGATVPQGALIEVDGAPVAAPGHLHLMLHKPSGVVTAREDGRFQTVFDILPASMRRGELSAVGRLDRDTTGLLFLTTDGQLAHRLISPRFVVEKAYRAEVEGVLAQPHIDRMAQGIVLSDFTARGARLEIVSPSVGILTVTEGKYHQVKRMFGALGCPVVRLHRLSVAGVPLDPALAPGQARPLNPEEARALYAAARMEDV